MSKMVPPGWFPSPVGPSCRRGTCPTTFRCWRSRHLGIDFGGLTAVDDFNLIVGKTEIAGLIGPNGAGKTTVFNLLTNVYKPTRGTILLNGNSTAGKSPYQVNRMGIARTFQNIRLFSNMSVLDNVKVGMHNAIPRQFGLLSLTARPATGKAEAPAGGEARMELLAVVRHGGARQGSRPAACPTARSAGWRSSAPWPPSQRSCCWMNRPPA